MINSIYLVLLFVCGSIPFGLIYGLIRGVDIRKTGSGNIGATNVARMFGFWGGFAPILLLDALKGVVPLVLFKYYQNPSELILTLGAVLAILGHVFSPWLGFKGGKGAATSAGVLLFLTPVPAAISLSIWVVAFLLLGRVVGRASVIASITYPIVTWFISTSLVFRILSLGIMLLIIYAHRSNIKAWFSHES